MGASCRRLFPFWSRGWSGLNGWCGQANARPATSLNANTIAREGTLHYTDIAPSDKAACIFPATAVFNPKKPDKSIILENLVSRKTLALAAKTTATEETATRLFSAAEHDDLPAIDSILTQRQYLEIEDYRGRTLLMAASEAAHAKCAALFVARGADVDAANITRATAHAPQPTGRRVPLACSAPRDTWR